MLRAILLTTLTGVAVIGALKWRETSSRQPVEGASAPAITKLPVNFAQRTFDPAAPPPDMPPLTPPEAAECDSVFLSKVSVAGETRPADATHGTVTVTQVRMTLQLNVTIWLPVGASEHVIEHEQGHRRISEAYYNTADQVARRIAATYIGKQVEISGVDLNAESDKALQQMAGQINDEYKRELDPQPTQLLYESITNHGRNDVVAKEAADHAIKNIAAEAPAPASSN